MRRAAVPCAMAAVLGATIVVVAPAASASEAVVPGARIVVDLADGRVSDLPDALGQVGMHGYRVSPDGRAIAFTALDPETGVARVTVARLDGTRLRRLSPADADADARDPAWSPDGRRLVYLEGSRLRIIDVRTGAARTVRGVQGLLSAPSFRPDGRAILYTWTSLWRGRSAVMTVPAGGGRPRQLIARAVGGTWSPDGSRIAYRPIGSFDGGGYHVGGVWLADAAGRRSRSLGGEGSFVRAPAMATYAAAARPLWSPDGSWIVYADGEGTTQAGGTDGIHVLDVRNGYAIRIATGSAPSWRSGRALIVERFEGRRAKARDARPLAEAEAEPARLSRATVSLKRDEARMLAAPLRREGAHDFHVSPDRTRVAFVSGYERLGTRRVMVAALDGTGLRSIGAADRESYDPAWTPDGKRIVYVDDALAFPGQRDARELDTRLMVADIDSGSATRVGGVKGRVRMPSVRADGRTILFTRFSDAGRRPELWVVPTSGGRPRRLMEKAAYGAWSPDGRSIAYRRLKGAVAPEVYPYDAGVWTAEADGRRARRIWRGAGCCHMAHVDWSASRPAWAPDGSRLVLVQAPADHRGDVMVLGVAGGRAIAVGQGVLPTWLDDETLIIQDYEALAPR